MVHVGKKPRREAVGLCRLLTVLLIVADWRMISHWTTSRGRTTPIRRDLGTSITKRMTSNISSSSRCRRRVRRCSTSCSHASRHATNSTLPSRGCWRQQTRRDMARKPTRRARRRRHRRTRSRELTARVLSTAAAAFVSKTRPRPGSTRWVTAEAADDDRWQMPASCVATWSSHQQQGASRHD